MPLVLALVAKTLGSSGATAGGSDVTGNGANAGVTVAAGATAAGVRLASMAWNALYKGS